MSVAEQVILGIIQGIAEWLPVSSEGLLVFTKTNFFGGSGIEILVREALFLHLGTFLAALIYFRKDVVTLLKTLLSYNKSSTENRHILRFLIIATSVSSVIGLILVKALFGFEDYFNLTGKGITLIVGFLLLGTAALQFKAKEIGFRKPQEIRDSDSILLGIAQGFAVLPGLSRSGFTISALLLRKFDKTQTLRLSFLMSLPAVLLGNVFLNWGNFALVADMFMGFIFAFIFGILTIHALLKISRRINFGYFVLLFGLLTILAVLI